MARIDLVDLAHSYGGNSADEATYALKPISMTWRQGGAYALLGPSGCGKTTLLNLISGIIIPSHGKILFDGNDVTQLSTQKRNIAQVFQFPVIYDTMTVGQNLAFPLKNRGVPRGEIDKRVAEIARLLDLTMIYVTHDQTEALTFADTVVVMHDGRVVQSGTPAELFEKPAHTFVGYFIGSPGMNIVPAEVRGREARIGGHVIALNRSYEKLPSGAKIEIGVRPEFVDVERPVPGLLSANIERIDDLGRIRFAHVRVGDAKLAARVPPGFSTDSNSAGLRFDPAHVHVYADSRLVEGAA